MDAAGPRADQPSEVRELGRRRRRHGRLRARRKGAAGQNERLLQNGGARSAALPGPVVLERNTGFEPATFAGRGSRQPRARGSGLEGSRTCSRMAWAVEERRTTATTRRVPPQRGQARTSVWKVRLRSWARGWGGGAVGGGQAPAPGGRKLPRWAPQGEEARARRGDAPGRWGRRPRSSGRGWPWGAGRARPRGGGRPPEAGRGVSLRWGRPASSGRRVVRRARPTAARATAARGRRSCTAARGPSRHSREARCRRGARSPRRRQFGGQTGAREDAARSVAPGCLRAGGCPARPRAPTPPRGRLAHGAARECAWPR